MKGLGRLRPDPAAVREARADLPLLLCLAALIALLTLAAAAGPPLLDRLTGRALVSRIDEAQRFVPGVEFGTQIEPSENYASAGESTLARDLDGARTVIEAAATGPLKGRMAHDSTRLQLPDLRATLPAAPRSRQQPVESMALSLLYADDAPGPAAYTEGRPPRETWQRIEIAVSTGTRDALGLRLGQSVPLRPGAAETEGTAVVVGFFRTGDSRLVRDMPLLALPVATPTGNGTGVRRQGAAITSASALEHLQQLSPTGRLRLSPVWRLRLVLDTSAAARLVGDEGRAAQRALVQYQERATEDFCPPVTESPSFSQCRVGDRAATGLTSHTPLPVALSEFERQWSQARVVMSFALASLICVGLATCVVTALLAVRRRLPAHRLQRARGASAAGLAGVRALQTAPFALAGCAAGALTAGAAVPSAASGPAYGQALLVMAVGWLLLPCLTWHAVRASTARARARHDTRRAAALRRVTAEGGVLLLAAGGVLALRARGITPAPDTQLAVVPALLGLAVVVLLVRCYPWPVRALARWAASRRGTVPLIAFSRAAKDAPARTLALLVLVVTLSTAVFSSLVAGTVTEGRDTAADWHVGADAALIGAHTHPEAAQALARAPGVHRSIDVRLIPVDLTGSSDGGRYGQADLVGLDGLALSAAAPGSPAGEVLRALPPGDGPGDGTQIPALAGPGLRTGEVYRAIVHGDELRIRIVGPLPDRVAHDRALGPVREGRSGRLLLADAAALKSLQRRATESSALLLYGSGIDPDALRGLVPSGGPSSPAGELRIRSDEQTRVGDDEVLNALTSVHLVCTALAALLALLALVLDLLLSAPERGRTAAQLRTLGLGGRATGALHLVQLLPMVLAAAAGGTVLGFALPALLGPALNLREFTGGPTAPALHTEYGPAIALSIGFAVLVATAVAVETWLARRRGLGAVLRLGEDAG